MAAFGALVLGDRVTTALCTSGIGVGSGLNERTFGAECRGESRGMGMGLSVEIFVGWTDDAEQMQPAKRDVDERKEQAKREEKGEMSAKTHRPLSFPQAAASPPPRFPPLHHSRTGLSSTHNSQAPSSHIAHKQSHPHHRAGPVMCHMMDKRDMIRCDELGNVILLRRRRRWSVLICASWKASLFVT